MSTNRAKPSQTKLTSEIVTNIYRVICEADDGNNALLRTTRIFFHDYFIQRKTSRSISLINFLKNLKDFFVAKTVPPEHVEAVIFNIQTDQAATFFAEIEQEEIDLHVMFDTIFKVHQSPKQELLERMMSGIRQSNFTNRFNIKDFIFHQGLKFHEEKKWGDAIQRYKTVLSLIQTENLTEDDKNRVIECLRLISFCYNEEACELAELSEYEYGVIKIRLAIQALDKLSEYLTLSQEDLIHLAQLETNYGTCLAEIAVHSKQGHKFNVAIKAWIAWRTESKEPPFTYENMQSLFEIEQWLIETTFDHARELESQKKYSAALDAYSLCFALIDNRLQRDKTYVEIADECWRRSGKCNYLIAKHNPTYNHLYYLNQAIKLTEKVSQQKQRDANNLYTYYLARDEITTVIKQKNDANYASTLFGASSIPSDRVANAKQQTRITTRRPSC